MAVRRVFSTALLTVVAVLCGFIGADSQPCNTITVEQSGENALECLNSSKPCKTLNYVLYNIDQRVSSCPDGELNVLVGYNHSIDSTSLALVNFTETANLTIAGSSPHGSVNISCESRSWGMQIIGNSNSSLTFKGLIFDGCSYNSTSPFFIIASGFAFVEIDTCTVTRCASVQLQAVESGVVRNSWFSFGKLNKINGLSYTSFALESDCHQLLVEASTFVNNNPSGGLGLRDCTASTTIIKDCLFDHNLPGLQLGRDFRSVKSLCKQDLLMEGTTFTRNPRAFFIYSSSLAEITVNSTKNQFVKRGTLFALGGAVVIASSHKTQILINFTQDLFVGNESPLGGMIWYDSSIQDTNNIVGITTRFVECSFSENKAGDGAVLYSDIRSSNVFISFTRCNITNNQIILRQSTILYSGIIHTQGGQLSLVDCIFANNAGTPVVLDTTEVIFKGSNMFSGNVGTWGGAIHWLTTFNITASGNSSVQIFDNTASKGGGIYIGPVKAYSKYSCGDCSLQFSLTDNVADSSGNSIYFENPEFIDTFDAHWKSRFHIDSSPKPSITSSVRSITTNTTAMSLFPGERIEVDVIAADYLNNNVSCDAQFTLLCMEMVCIRNSQPQLKGDSVYAPLLYVHTLESGPQLTPLSIASDDGPWPIKLNLVFWCEYSVNNVSIAVNLTSCPEGFYYDSSAKVCKCLENSDTIACSVEYGVACILQGYWFGRTANLTSNMSQYTVAPCDPKFCSRATLQLCPSQVTPTLGATFYVLPRENLDDQCDNNQGGFLCYGCREDYEFTFQAVRCIPQSQCGLWQPPILILFTLLYQVATVTFIILALRLKLKVGSGILYGPLFALVATNLLLNSCHSSSFITLQVAVTTISSLLQLNPEFFGYIPWCFIEALGRLGNYALRYLSPAIIGLSLFLLACIARRFPKFLSAVQRSPVQLICLLMLLTFWSLTETTFMLLIPITIPGVPGVRVFNDPDVRYFHGEHIVLALLAIAVALVFILPFAAILLVSPFMRARLHRISPILDEFQSCYKDKFRWYSATYLIFWVAISISHQLSPTAVLMELITLAVLHFVVQPYSNRWLNTMDSLILIDLVLLSALFSNTSYCSTAATSSGFSAGLLLVYLLVLFPVSIIPFGVVFFVIRRFFRAYKHSKSKSEDPLVYYEIIDKNEASVNGPSTSTVSMDDNFLLSVEEREPVIALEQNTRR